MSRHSSTLLSFWHTIVIMAAVGLLLGVILSLLRPLEYSSTTRLLIIQQLGTVDAYTASRSAERVAEDITNVVYTSTFFKGDGLNRKSIKTIFRAMKSDCARCGAKRLTRSSPRNRFAADHCLSSRSRLLN